MSKRSEEGVRAAQNSAFHEASGPAAAPMRDSASARGPLSSAPSPRSQGSQLSYQRVMLKSSGGSQATGANAASTAEAGFSKGQSIPLPHKASMEQSFGTSFSNVKATVAPEATASLGAEAYAKGSSVAFSTPNPSKGTVAHELTHVVQQSGGLGGQGNDGAGIPLGPSSASTTAGAEAEADAVAAKVATGAAVGAGDISSAEPNVAKLSIRGALGMKDKSKDQEDDDNEEEVRPSFTTEDMGRGDMMAYYGSDSEMAGDAGGEKQKKLLGLYLGTDGDGFSTYLNTYQTKEGRAAYYTLSGRAQVGNDEVDIQWFMSEDDFQSVRVSMMCEVKINSGGLNLRGGIAKVGGMLDGLTGPLALASLAKDKLDNTATIEVDFRAYKDGDIKFLKYSCKGQGHEGKENSDGGFDLTIKKW